MLAPYFDPEKIEVGCDEAGRGALAGPVVAAAVVLPKKFRHPLLNDSKQLNASQRVKMRSIIEENALAYGVAVVDNFQIDAINILNATFLAMHIAIDKVILTLKPDLILVDGNRFLRYPGIPHKCIIRGDGLYQSIAAASILAKTYRDEIMLELHERHPQYHWKSNKGYATLSHRQSLKQYGITPYHRKSFQLLPLPKQGVLFGE